MPPALLPRGVLSVLAGLDDVSRLVLGICSRPRCKETTCFETSAKLFGAPFPTGFWATNGCIERRRHNAEFLDMSIEFERDKTVTGVVCADAVYPRILLTGHTPCSRKWQCIYPEFSSLSSLSAVDNQIDFDDEMNRTEIC